MTAQSRNAPRTTHTAIEPPSSSATQMRLSSSPIRYIRGRYACCIPHWIVYQTRKPIIRKNLLPGRLNTLAGLLVWGIFSFWNRENDTGGQKYTPTCSNKLKQTGITSCRADMSGGWPFLKQVLYRIMWSCMGPMVKNLPPKYGCGELWASSVC